VSARVIVVGSLNVDLVAGVERLPQAGETVSGTDLVRTPGGKGLNQAVAAARAGVPVVLVGAVGDDEHGRWLRQVATDEGIDVSCLSVAAGAATGTALITVAGDGANTIVVSPGANAEASAVTVGSGGAVAARAGDVVLCQAEVPGATVAAALTAGRRAGATTMVNLAPFRESGDGEWDLVDVLVVNETELAALLAAGGIAEPVPSEHDDPERARELTHVAVRSLLGARPGPAWVVVSLGATGAVAVDGRGAGSVLVPAPRVVAVDTVGAGDCLTGWLAAELTRGRDMVAGLGRAVRAAAVAVQRRGAAAAMPTPAEVDASSSEGA